MTRTDLATAIKLTNGDIIAVKYCIGLNYTNGVPSDYGVRTIDNEPQIIPRENIERFILPTGYKFPQEVAA